MIQTTFNLLSCLLKCNRYDTMKISLCILLLLLTFQQKTAAQTDTIFRSLSAIQVDEGVQIGFTIKGGITCSGVKIERSANNMDFKAIYEIVGVCGAATSDESYAYIDENPVLINTSFYRLNLGSLGLYSDTLTVRYIGYDENGVAVFPNPCIGNCHFYFKNELKDFHEIRLFNNSGQVVRVFGTTEKQWHVALDGLSTGMYFYQVSREGIVISSGKIIVV